MVGSCVDLTLQEGVLFFFSLPNLLEKPKMENGRVSLFTGTQRSKTRKVDRRKAEKINSRGLGWGAVPRFLRGNIYNLCGKSSILNKLPIYERVHSHCRLNDLHGC